MGKRTSTILGALAIVLIGGAALSPAIRARVRKVVRPRVDVSARCTEFGTAARERMKPGFARAGVEYPPRRVTLIAFKQERRLEVFAGGQDSVTGMVLEYRILAASGKTGPKLREGDMQVPEGVYAIESLNPNSMYHVALRVGYPSEEDRARAAEDGRTQLGGDIMIHGGAGSVGCLAVGDPAAEELFVLAADVGIQGVELLICPVDWRRPDARVGIEGMPAWVATRYALLRERLKDLQRP